MIVNTKTFSQIGTVKYQQIHSQSLANNKLGDPAVQNVAIYLPPSYETSVKRYPVIYFLPGFVDQVSGWVDGVYLNYRHHLMI